MTTAARLEFSAIDRPRRLTAGVVIACLAVGLQSAGAADDVVYLTRGKNLQWTTKLTGRIIDYTGQELTLLVGGTPTSHKAEHVIRVETELSAEHQAADELFVKGLFREALAQYSAAGRGEQRRFIRRQILAQMTWCHRHLADVAEAGDTFLSLVESDPHTIHFDCIPLTWQAAEPPRPLHDKCRQWLDDPSNSVAGLIAASHLLSTAESPAATRRLEQLEYDGNSHVALLAQAQLWRVRMVTGDAEQFAAWSRVVRRMPESLRAGPYFVLGQAWSRSGDHTQAALHFMRVPILHSADRGLSAAALLAASQSLVRLGQDREAARVWAEIATQYPQSDAASEARRLLNEHAPPVQTP